MQIKTDHAISFLDYLDSGQERRWSNYDRFVEDKDKSKQKGNPRSNL